MNVEIIGNENSRGSSGDQSLWVQQGGGSEDSEPVPETVTVTLTQTSGEGTVEKKLLFVVCQIIFLLWVCILRI